jgi:hypothetical protein
MKPIYIEWEDSASSRGWMAEDTQGPVLIRSIGWLIHRLPHCIVISTSKSSAGNMMDPLTIPKSCIKKLRRVKL